jgi:hypothetical protein
MQAFIELLKQATEKGITVRISVDDHDTFIIRCHTISLSVVTTRHYRMNIDYKRLNKEEFEVALADGLAICLHEIERMG